MSATVTDAPQAVPPAPARRPLLSAPLLRGLSVAAAVLVGLTLARAFSGAEDLTSTGTMSAALGAAVPLALAGAAGVWSERAGIVNIGLEGMMMLGSFGGGWIGWLHGPWAGLVAAVLFGALGGLVHAVATVSLGVDHTVSGVAINILVAGAVRFAASIAFAGQQGGGATQSPAHGPLGTLSVPGLGDALTSLAARHLFVISDLAAVLAAVTRNVSWLTLIAVALIALTGWVLWRTPFGLRLRSCGEDPWAAESLGVNVYLYKYLGVLVSGGLAGLGGGYLSIVASLSYREGQTGGRGYIGLAAMLFGNWRPGSMLTGALLFGYTDAMQLRNAAAVHAFLLVFALGLLGVAVLLLVRRSYAAAAVSAVSAVLFLAWFTLSDQLPSQVAQALPFLTTLVVIAASSQRLRMPKADGQVYRKGEAR